MNKIPALKFKSIEIGDKINKLTVIGEAEPRYFKHKNGKYYSKKMWLCECECGGSTCVEDNKLKSGHTKSCGCLNTKHKNIPLLLNRDLIKYASVAQNILNRCRNPYASEFYRYGGRGIKCELGDSVTLIAKNLSKIPGWFKGAELDRIDNNKNYTMNNIRWVSHDDNIRNSSIVSCITKDDISMGLLTTGGFVRNVNNMNGDPSEYERIEIGFPIYRREEAVKLYLFVHNSHSWEDKMKFYTRIQKIYEEAIKNYDDRRKIYPKQTARLLINANK